MYENVDIEKIRVYYEIWKDSNLIPGVSELFEFSDGIMKQFYEYEDYYMKCTILFYYLKFKKTGMLIKHCNCKKEDLIKLVKFENQYLSQEERMYTLI